MSLTNTTTPWSYSLLERMGYIKRKAQPTTKTSLSEQEIQVAKEMYLEKIKRVITDCKIPPPLITNWDQSGTNTLLLSEWTLVPSGLEISRYRDKCHITLTSDSTLSGRILPF